jgi:hypothetical protein
VERLLLLEDINWTAPHCRPQTRLLQVNKALPPLKVKSTRSCLRQSHRSHQSRRRRRFGHRNHTVLSPSRDRSNSSSIRSLLTALRALLDSFKDQALVHRDHLRGMAAAAAAAAVVVVVVVVVQVVAMCVRRADRNRTIRNMCHPPHSLLREGHRDLTVLLHPQPTWSVPSVNSHER